MSDFDPRADLVIANQMADAARAAIKPYFRQSLTVENKLARGFDPVTVADRASETAMRAVLDEMAPDDGILGEEFPERISKNGRQWVLDPIDGTRAFIAGLPSWTVLIALSVNGRPRLGLIDQPHIGERFTGWNDGASYGQGEQIQPLQTRNTGGLADAILATTDAFLFRDAERDAFDALRQAVRLCRYGYDGYAYAMLAQGGIDLVVESGLQPYDVQALMPIIRGAGGMITNWTGGDCSDGGQVIAAAHPELHAEALGWLKAAAH